jgi:N-acetylneuraminic acid mutarotase
MRTRARAAFPFLLTVFAASASFAACADALHLDPPTGSAGTASSGSTSSGGTGGSVKTGDGGTEAGSSCKSNPDCAYPTPVCDTTTDTCVQCLVVSDCADLPGTVCSLGQCGCPAPPGSTIQYCASETPSCIDTSTSITNCGSCGHACFGSCTASKCPNGWSPTSTTGAPEQRSHHVAAWTGTQMFVWGGRDGATALASGALYDPVKQAWTPTSTMNAPSARYDATAVWDDVHNQVIVWGGTANGSTFLNDGGIYNPSTDTWTPMSTGNNVPAGRFAHTAVWVHALSGFSPATSGMIVWGGVGAPYPTYLGDGAVFDPSSNTWLGATDTTGAPTARGYHVGVWDSGSRMVIYGGEALTGTPPTTMNTALGDAYSYDPAEMGMGSTWATLTMPPALGPRFQATGLWDKVSSQTIIWGGFDGTNYLTDGATLTAPATWATIGSGGMAPEGRVNHSAVILASGTKSQLVVFGGDQGGSTILATGWSLDIQASTWTELPTPGPTGRTGHTAVADGATMILWGGDTAAGPTNTGATYAAGM